MLNQHQTTRDLIAKYNRPTQLADCLVPLLGLYQHVNILDVGSGPFSVIGSYFPGREISITHCDKQDFNDFWRKQKTEPFIKTDHENMEHLSYPDNTFDIVCCINTLDHTREAHEAINEMIRVCKPKGFVYIDCCLDQMTTGHKHYWNAKADGTLRNDNSTIFLDAFGFDIKFIDNGGESRYNHIIATLQK